MGAGMFLCRHPNAVTAAFRAQTSYMPGKTAGPVVDPYTSSVQWSRRFIGLKLFVALAERGEAGSVAQIEQQAHIGNVMRICLARAGWRVVNHTPLPLICFDRDGLVVGDFLDALYEHQIAWMSEVRFAGRRSVVRACVTSFRTTEDDVEQVVREMTHLALHQVEVTT
jgi:glutamate/tyrosine decarboxylase-like PLP-dependent enzyme